MEAHFRALVIAATGLAARRVNWAQDPNADGTAYVTIHLISQTGGATMQGPDGLFTGRVQVDCFAPDFLAAADLAAAIIDGLNGLRDATFRAIFFDNMRSSREPGANDGESIYRRSMDFIAHWRAPNAG